MKSYRLQRLNREIKKIFNTTLVSQINDHRLDWVTITDIVLSKDLKYLKAYFSHYNNPLSHNEIKQLLQQISGFLKKKIAGAKIMRTIPEITFYYDDTEEKASKIDVLLSSVKDDYDDEDDYDPDIDIDDHLEDDEYYEFDEDDEDFEDYEEEDDEEDY